jgi:CheY-like chemotaxis protein
MTKHGTILLVEGDANDVLHVKKAFAEVEIVNPLQTVYSHTDAVKYLSGDGIYADRTAFPLPFLLVLDLALPEEGGYALLRWLYERPGLRKKFSVIILTPGGPGQEIQLAYELGAQSVLLKPPTHKQLVDTLYRVKQYWIDLNLPPGNPS